VVLATEFQSEKNLAATVYPNGPDGTICGTVLTDLALNRFRGDQPAVNYLQNQGGTGGNTVPAIIAAQTDIDLPFGNFPGNWQNIAVFQGAGRAMGNTGGFVTISTEVADHRRLFV
jgi:hypothetical protein